MVNKDVGTMTLSEWFEQYSLDNDNDNLTYLNLHFQHASGEGCNINYPKKKLIEYQWH